MNNHIAALDLKIGGVRLWLDRLIGGPERPGFQTESSSVGQFSPKSQKAEPADKTSLMSVIRSPRTVFTVSSLIFKMEFP